MSQPVYVLGGSQTDFALNAARQGLGLFELMRDAVVAALDDAGLAAQDIQSGHVGNFVGELFTGQGQLGGMFEAIDPGFHGMPAGRHEAACASGSIALLAATAEIEAGRYDCVLVTGVELERNVPGAVAAQHLGAATWVGEEAQGAKYAWPHMFHRVGRNTSAATACATSTWRASPRSTSATRGATPWRKRAVGNTRPRASPPTTPPTRSSKA